MPTSTMFRFNIALTNPNLLNKLEKKNNRKENDKLVLQLYSIPILIYKVKTKRVFEIMINVIFYDFCLEIN